MAKLIHLSDLHFGDPLLSWGLLRSQGQIFSKQSIGLVNHLANQHRHFDPKKKELLIENLVTIDWDIIVITGDLVHLGTKAEFKLARTMLEPLIQKGTVLLTAGNHDRYTPKTLGRIEDTFGDCYPFNQSSPCVFEGPNQWGLIELPMARPSGLWAKGKFSGQFEEYKQLIERRGKKPTLLYGHYPLYHPPGRSERFGHQLWNLENVRALTQLPGIKGYLHGHMHESWAFQPAGTDLWSINAGGSLKDGYWSLQLAEQGIFPSKQPLQF